MSKRADQKASEAFPDIPLPNLGKDIVAKRGKLRRAYIQGYEQAEKDTIERVVKWLKENWREYVWTTDNGVPHFGHWENDFRKAMEGK